MKKKLALLFGYLFIGIGLITAQTQKVTGTVISDDDKQPVVGASIVVKGTNLGTITDIDGHFTLLNVPNSAKILQISYIGMKTESVSVQPTVRVFYDKEKGIITDPSVLFPDAPKLKKGIKGIAKPQVVKKDNRVPAKLIVNEQVKVNTPGVMRSESVIYLDLKKLGKHPHSK